jgi:serine phosphatase RsbU (regulator of sigma subunit)
MARTIRRVLPCLFLLVAATLNAQTPAQPDRTAHVTLGQAAVPLYGPWKFNVGDSPIDPKTSKPLWAEPDFDDSRWETVDLTPKDRTIDPNSGQSGYVPGWTAKGHPGYWGYAWYRIRVEVQARPGAALALAGPADVDDAYEVFDNGALAGHFGDFTGSKPRVYYTQPKMFGLPGPGNRAATAGQGAAIPDETSANGTGAGESTTQVLAFRLWMEPGTLVNEPDTGGMHSTPVLGEVGAVAAGYQMRWLELIRSYASHAVEALLFSLLAVVAFSLILFDRSDRVYLWMAALFLLLAVNLALTVISEWTEIQSVPVNNLLVDGTGALIWAVWVMVWWVWFGLERPRWLPRLAAGLTPLLMASGILRDEVFFGLVPHAVAAHFVTVDLVLKLLFFALLLWIVMEGIRRQGVEGWLVMPVVVLRGMSAFTFQLSLLHIRMRWFPFGAQVNLSALANLLVAVVIALLLLRRLLQSVKRQRLMALDVKQAQEVQQVILPEAKLVLPGVAGLPGLTIESEYRPAREVGGDFFQIIPHKADGSLLIVAGDVAGKGLKAGMLVALLIGAIRTAAETDSDPAVVLAALNRRLLGRSDARATCLALRIDQDGCATLANAGHLPPYLNGEPVEIEGSLPLGMIENLDCSVLEFRLSPSDRLLLVSDGVPEATDSQGKLFGFDRLLELIRDQPSAASIAETAQAFGQEDDISVISVTRAPVAAPVLA